MGTGPSSHDIADRVAEHGARGIKQYADMARDLGRGIALTPQLQITLKPGPKGMVEVRWQAVDGKRKGGINAKLLSTPQERAAFMEGLAEVVG